MNVRSVLKMHKRAKACRVSALLCGVSSKPAQKKRGGSSIRPYMAEEDISSASDWGAAAAAVCARSLSLSVCVRVLVCSSLGDTTHTHTHPQTPTHTRTESGDDRNETKGVKSGDVMNLVCIIHGLLGWSKPSATRFDKIALLKKIFALKGTMLACGKRKSKVKSVKTFH